MRFVYSEENPEAKVAFASFEAMHTVLETVFVGESRRRAEFLSGKIESLTRRTESVLSRHQSGSAFFRINASAWADPVEIDGELFQLLSLCSRFRLDTLGYFDISALSEAPSSAEPYALTDTPGMQPGQKPSVQLTREGLILDAGAFGKGYAVDLIRDMLTQEGVSRALINFGDSSIYALGTHPYGECWSLSPRHGAAAFSLKDSALSVSGLHPDGSAHIFDPHTGCRVGSDVMIAVEGESALVCEVLSTALYAAPAEKRPAIIKNFPGYRYKEI